MSLAYTVDADQRLITISGEYADSTAWTALLSRLLHDPRRETGFAFLRDLRRARQPSNAAVVPDVIEAVRRFWPHLQPWRVAIVTSAEEDPAASAADALARTYRLPLRMFTSYDAARAWLQRD